MSFLHSAVFLPSLITCVRTPLLAVFAVTLLSGRECDGSVSLSPSSLEVSSARYLKKLGRKNVQIKPRIDKVRQLF